jgi:putative copper export protein
MRLSLLMKTAFLVLYFIIPKTNSWQLHSTVARRETKARHPVPVLHTPKSFISSLQAVTMTDATVSNEAWTKPRLHNTGAFRSVAILGAIAAAGLSSNSPFHLLSAQSMAALHLFSYATWFGTMVYTTFILGITMFKNLPRKTFGNLQAKLFPMYFALSSIAIILQVSTLKFAFL